MPIFKNLFGPSGPEQNQGQGEGNEKYTNIREQPGTNGRLFWGEDPNVQGIQGGGPTSHLLVPDGKGGYRRATEEEVQRILEEEIGEGSNG